MAKMRARTMISLVLLAIALAIWIFSQTVLVADQTSGSNVKPALGNPAAVYCMEIMGYDYKTITDLDGGERGICVLPDNQECDQWDFYAGTCGQDYGYCAQQGYQTETRTDGQDPFSPNYAVCTSTDKQVVGSVMQLADLNTRAAGSSFEEDPAVVIDPTVQEEGEAPVPDDGTMVLSVPSSFDWRNYQGYNWLTSVKNQSSCGSCWAFAAVGVAEAHHNIVKNNANLDLNLAEQDLVSCSGIGNCERGGSSLSALSYMQGSGIVDENCIPYTAQDSSCSKCSDWQNRLTYVDDVYEFSPSRQSIRQNVVTYGPVYVAMGVNAAFGGYFDSNGIYRCSNDWGSNHAVVVVGYDDAGGYWIVRNSWGSTWDGDGYFKVGYGECALESTEAAYTYITLPTKASSIQPDGWSGPYTNDSTPRFRWNAASDSGSGLAGYYVAVDDWTPEGTAGNDWWVGDVTAYTVPAAQSDGAHTFAVTSKDRFGNVNPANTNQAGDGPYYTFYVDTVAPSSAVQALAAEQQQASFLVRWGGSDATSGIAGYDIQYRKGTSGSWVTWLSNTTASSATFQGRGEGTYYFRSRARDRANNVESWPSGNGDTYTYVPIVEVHLPLIVKNYGTPSGGLFLNGGFESGATIWTEYSSNGWPLILYKDALPAAPHNGNWAAWLGGDHNENSYIQQQVTVPSTTPYLAYWYWIGSEDVCGYDYGGVRVNGIAVDSLNLCSDTSTSGWVKRTINLSGYAGQSVALRIWVNTDGSLNSNLFLDDFAFQSGSLLEPAYDTSKTEPDDLSHVSRR